MMMWKVLLIFIISEQVFCKNISQSNDENNIKNSKTSMMKTMEYEVNDDFGLPMLSRDMTFLSIIIDTIKNENCKKHAIMILQETQNLTNWAVKFYDSSGKFPEGLLSGSTYQFGNFDECIDIGNDNNLPGDIRGKYCLGNIKIQVPQIYLNKASSIWQNFRNRSKRYDESISELNWGICVPASCQSEDIQDIIERIIGFAFSNSKLKLTPIINKQKCYTNEQQQQQQYDSIDFIYLLIIMTIVSLIIIGTIFDVIYSKNNNDKSPSIGLQVMNAFSFVSNLKRLCSPANDDGLGLDCISGIKFIAMAFIVAGHCLVFIIGGPILNQNFWTKAITKYENSIFLNNPLLVDTFLLLSGFLFSRILLKELDKRRSVNFLYLYIFRYIRYVA